MSAGYVPFFHVGILVRDIDQAAEDLEALLGLQFEPVRAAPMVSGDIGRFRYSLQGPPYLELVQIAFSEPDVPSRCAAFGGEADAVVQGEGGVARVIFTRPGALHGIRAEYLESPMVAATLERLRAFTR